MKTYTQDYTKIEDAEGLIFFAEVRMRAYGCDGEAIEHISAARKLLHEYTNDTNLVEDDDVADGLVKQSEAEAAIEEAKQEDMLKTTIESLYYWLDAGEPSVTLERPYGLDCDVTITIKKK